MHLHLFNYCSKHYLFPLCLNTFNFNVQLAHNNCCPEQFQPEDPPYCFLFFTFLNENIMARVSFTGCPCLSSWSQWFTEGISVHCPQDMA